MEDFGSFGTFDRVFDSERGVGKDDASPDVTGSGKG
jgi:hypothetical protein